MKTKVIRTRRYYYEDADAPEDADHLPASMHAMARRAMGTGETEVAEPAPEPAGEISEAGEGEEPASGRGRRGRRRAAEG